MNYRLQYTHSYALAIMILLCPASAHAQDQAASPVLAIPSVFQAALDEAGMSFDGRGFEEFTVTRVLENLQVSYWLAVRHRTMPLEVRYVVHTNYTQDQTMYAQVVLMNLARKGNPDPEIRSVDAIDQPSVRAEYGADQGWSATFIPDPTFSTYRRGWVWLFTNQQRNTLAAVVFLFNTSDSTVFVPESVAAAIQPIQYALRFNQ